MSNSSVIAIFAVFMAVLIKVMLATALHVIGIQLLYPSQWCHLFNLKNIQVNMAPPLVEKMSCISFCLQY